MAEVKAEGEQHTDSVLEAQGPALQHRTSRQSRAPSTAPSKQREGVQIHTDSSRNRRWRQRCAEAFPVLSLRLRHQPKDRT